MHDSDESKPKRFQSLTYKKMRLARLEASGMPGSEAARIIYSNQKDPSYYYYEFIQPQELYQEYLQQLRDAFAIRMKCNATFRAKEFLALYNESRENNDRCTACKCLENLGKLIKDTLPVSVTTTSENGEEMDLPKRLSVYREALLNGSIDQGFYDTLHKGEIDGEKEKLFVEMAQLLDKHNSKEKKDGKIELQAEEEDAEK